MFLNPTNVVKIFSVAAVLLGAAIFVSWFLIGRSLEDDVQRMVAVMWNVETVHAKVQIATDTFSELPIFPTEEGGTIRFGAEGDIDLSQKPDFLYTGDFKIQTSTKGASAVGEIRNLASAFYLFISQAPTYGDVDLSAFADEWIYIPKTFSLDALFGKESPPDLSLEDLDSLREVLTQVDIVDVPETGIIELIDGDPCLPYSFVVDQNGMLIFLSTLWEKQHDTALDLASFQTIQHQVFSMLDWKGTMWIGKKSFLLHRLKLDASNFSFTLSLSDFNESVKISEPSEKSLTIQKALQSLGLNAEALPSSKERLNSVTEKSSQQSTTGNEQFASSTTNDDPDQDGLPNSLEIFYLTDSHNPDSDGDGVLDGEEVQKGQNPNGQGSIFSFGLPF